MASNSPTYFLSSLFVFKNTLNQELIRTLHVHKLVLSTDDDDHCKKETEREFLFSDKGSYVELKATPYLTLQGSPVSQIVEGQFIGLWLCIFSFQADGHPQFTNIPPILCVSRNPKLRAVPTLTNELEMIFQSSPMMRRSSTVQIEMHKGNEENKEPPKFPIKMLKASRDGCHYSRVHCVFDMVLNSPPNDVATINQSGPGISAHKRKRSAPEYIARLTLEDLAKYFDHPIAEASRELNIGLTVLKKKCREFGIPRWPHRKIKSLDCLIHDLQEEEKRHQADKAAVDAVKRRQKMLENEKERIQKTPFVEIQNETKRFRQDVFKRRHKAKASKDRGPSESSNNH